MQITHTEFFKTSLPFIISSIAVPLMGSVDTAVVGRLGSYHFINAVALGAVIFSTIFWLFNFLRLTSSGFASQSLGRNDAEEELYSFLRGGSLALIIGALIVAFKNFIFEGAVYYFNPPAETAQYMQQYFNIIIYTVPLALFYQTAQGWLAGITKVRHSVAIGLLSNFINMLLDFVFVYYFNAGVDGVAYATAIAHGCAFIAAVCFFKRYAPYPLTQINYQRLIKSPDFFKLINCSMHLMVRTLCMLIMINTFMAQSAAFGGKILAANSILMQIQYIMGDVFAGFSQAAAIYAGLAVGSGNKKVLIKNLKISAVQCLGVGMLQAAVYYCLRSRILFLFTDLPEVLAAAVEFDIFITFFPVLSALGIVYYGIFNGALQTTPICLSMLITAAAYLAAKSLLVPEWGNIGLWLAFLVFYFSRTAFLLVFLPSFIKRFPYSRLKLQA